jgi:hypothetical protein
MQTAKRRYLKISITTEDGELLDSLRVFYDGAALTPAKAQHSLTAILESRFETNPPVDEGC